MAHALGIRVIAEGVETVQQRDFLHRYGSDEIQGYFFSPPVEGPEFLRLIAGRDSLRR